MTTRITITNHGPGEVSIERSGHGNPELVTLKPGQACDNYVHSGSRLAVTEHKGDSDVTNPEPIDGSKPIGQAYETSAPQPDTLATTLGVPVTTFEAGGAAPPIGVPIDTGSPCDPSYSASSSVDSCSSSDSGSSSSGGE